MNVTPGSRYWSELTLLDTRDLSLRWDGSVKMSYNEFDWLFNIFRKCVRTSCWQCWALLWYDHARAAHAQSTIQGFTLACSLVARVHLSKSYLNQQKIMLQLMNLLSNRWAWGRHLKRRHSFKHLKALNFARDLFCEFRGRTVSEKKLNTTRTFWPCIVTM